MRRRLALAAIAIVVLMGGGWAVQGDDIAQAEQELAVQQVKTETLTAQVNALAPVREYYAAMARQKKTVTSVMASEVLFSRIITELHARTPPEVLIETMSVAIQPTGPRAAAAGTGVDPAATAASATDCPSPEPFGAKPAVGCITISGSAVNREAVGSLITRLGESDVFVGPFVSTSTVSDEGWVTFTGTVGLTRKVLSGRYAELGWITADASSSAPSAAPDPGSGHATGTGATK